MGGVQSLLSILLNLNEFFVTTSSFTAGVMPLAGHLLPAKTKPALVHVCWDVFLFSVLSEAISLFYLLGLRLLDTVRRPRPLAVSKVISAPPTFRPAGVPPCPSRPPRSPEVEGQGHGQDDAHQHQERQPGLQEAHAADMLSMDQSEEAEVDHVPRGTVFISHQIQSHGDM